MLSRMAQDEHACLHGIGRQEDLRHEEDAVAEIDADDAHALDQRLGQGVIGGPAAVQQDMDRLLDLFLEAVVEIVVHLLHEIVVRQAVQIEFAFIGHDPGPCMPAASGRDQLFSFSRHKLVKAALGPTCGGDIICPLDDMGGN